LAVDALVVFQTLDVRGLTKLRRGFKAALFLKNGVDVGVGSDCLICHSGGPCAMVFAPAFYLCEGGIVCRAMKREHTLNHEGTEVSRRSFCVWCPSCSFVSFVVVFKLIHYLDLDLNCLRCRINSQLLH